MSLLAYFNSYNIPNELMLATFKEFTVEDFQKLMCTIKNMDLKDFQVYDYLLLFLSQQGTYIDDSLPDLGLFAEHYILPNTPIMEYCGELVSHRRAHRRAMNYRRDGIHGDYMPPVPTRQFSMPLSSGTVRVTSITFVARMSSSTRYLWAVVTI